MAYQSVHTGPEVDAAVSVLSDVQDIRDQVAADKDTVTTLAGQTATNAGLAQTAATNAQADAASALASKNDAHTSAQTAGAHAANADSARALAVVARNGAEQAQDSAWEAEGEVRYLLSDSEATIDSIRAEILRQKYGAGPYPSLDIGMVGANVLDRRVTFTRLSDATYWDSLGALQTAGPNEPRFDYDPVTGESLGLLVEGQATNLLRWSNDYTYATWTKNESTVQTSASMAPDQTLTMCKLVENSANSSHHISSSADYTEGQMYTASVIAKAAERTSLSLQLSPGAFGASVTASFNLVAETAILHIPGTESSVRIEPLGSGFYLCSLTSRAIATFSAVFSIYVEASPNVRIYQGDGASGIYLWGAQSEIGSKATSRIKTEASQVTRAASYPRVESDDFIQMLNPNEWTLHISGVFLGAVDNGYLVALSDGTTSNYIGVRISRTTSRITLLSSDGPALIGNYVMPGERFNVAVRCSRENGYELFDAGEKNPGSGTTSAAVGMLELGTLAGSNLFRASSEFEKLALYPRALPDAKLVELTTP